MRTTAAVLLTVLLTSVAAAQTDERARRVDQLFAEWVTPASPGAAVAIVQDGEIIYAQGYGLATLEHHVPITPQSVFYLGSVSKQFVAMAIALLDQDGTLSLDDDIRRWVPEIPDYGTPVIIRHLVHHTSGIRDYLGLMGLAGLELGHFETNTGVIDLLARQRALNFAPGEEYLYSNSGYFLLAVIVERASGKSLREYAQERIFGALGMENSHFHDRRSHIIENRAFGYLPTSEGGYSQFFTGFDRVGSGGVFSTVEDLFLWDQNFYHHEVGGAELIDRLHARGTLNSGEQITYAFGLVIGEYRGLKTVSHGGALGGYRSAFVRFPEQRFSVIVLANVTSLPGDLPNEIADIYLADPMAVASATTGSSPSARADQLEFVDVPERDLERVGGHYWNAAASYARRLYVRDGTLMYHRRPGNETALAPLGGDRFLMRGIPNRVEVRFAPAGETPRQMIVTIDGGEPIVSDAFEPADLSRAELEAYAGAYYSAELDTEYSIEATASGLTLVGARRPENRFLFVPLFADTFNNAVIGSVLRFARDGQGAITGATLDTGRVRGVEFERR